MLTCAGSQDQIQTMVTEAEANGLDIRLRELHEYRIQETPLDVLTDRQRDVLEVAFDRGYYDIPRSVSTSEIAAEFGLDDSTVSEHLQRAERNLAASMLGRTVS